MGEEYLLKETPSKATVKCKHEVDEDEFVMQCYPGFLPLFLPRVELSLPCARERT